jgi:hypothetical protein
VLTQIQAHLHSGVATPHDHHFLALEPPPTPVLAGMQHLTLKPLPPFHLGHDHLRVLPAGHHQPLGHELRRHAVVRRDSCHAPEPRRRVEPRARHGAAEQRGHGEALGVGAEVAEELVLGGVGGEVGWEGDVGQLAEDLGEVQAEAVVGAVRPQVGDAVGALQDGERDPVPAERRRDGEAGRPRADDDGTVHNAAAGTLLIRARTRSLVLHGDRPEQELMS